MTRALFLSCSQAKNPAAGLLPAVERYNGPAFRTLRLWREQAGNLRVWVLSAEHGLIPENKKIANYDRRMDAARAAELREGTAAKLSNIAAAHSFSSVLICMADAYTPAFPTHFLNDAGVERAGGRIGGKISRLKTWLGGDNIAPFAGEISAKKREARIGRKVYRVSAAQGMALARKGLAQDGTAAANWQTWHVPVAGGCVGAKWLVAKLTKLPVSQFRTADALRVLRIWGIPYNNGSRK